MTGMPPTHDRRYWDALLAAEGMPAEVQPLPADYRFAPPERTLRLRGHLRDRVERVHRRRVDALAYYDYAADYLWRGCDWSAYPQRHRVIWELHALEGMSLTAIATRLRYSRRLVWLVVRRHVRLMRER